MHDLLQGIVGTIQPFAERLGGAGLALLAFLDSSFLSFPEVPDVLIVVLVIQHPARWLYYGVATTLGSAAGCYVLFGVARRGGEALLRKRFSAERLDRALGYFRRFGMLAVIIPSILPPPTPFKVFVLLAGVARVRRSTFLVAILIGRSIRYIGEAFLAYEYGDRAVAFIRDSGPVFGLWLAAVIGLSAMAYVLWRRRRPA